MKQRMTAKFKVKMEVRLMWLSLLLMMMSWKLLQAQPVEEFAAHNPMEFHNIAMNAFMELRKQDPTQNLSYEGDFMKKANEHAVRRMRRKPEEALTLKVSRSRSSQLN